MNMCSIKFNPFKLPDFVSVVLIFNILFRPLVVWVVLMAVLHTSCLLTIMCILTLHLFPLSTTLPQAHHGTCVTSAHKLNKRTE